MTGSKRLQTLIITALLFVVGLGTTAWYGPSQLRDANATEEWPKVLGKVVDSRVYSQRRKNRTDWMVGVTYSYTVADATHQSSRYSITGDPGAESEDRANLLAKSFRAGDNVTVYYDPEDPAQAVLARGGTKKAWMTIAFGGLLLVASAVIGLKSLLRG